MLCSSILAVGMGQAGRLGEDDTSFCTLEHEYTAVQQLDAYIAAPYQSVALHSRLCLAESEAFVQLTCDPSARCH